MTERTDRIRYLNDLARTTPWTVNARWAMTKAVADLIARDTQASFSDAPRAAQLCAAIVSFADFSEGDDPYREHDFGFFELFGWRLLFKIDYFPPDGDTHAPDPSDIEHCRRVLRIMLAEEYRFTELTSSKNQRPI